MRKKPESEPWLGVYVGILMTNFGRVWRKESESEAWSVCRILMTNVGGRRRKVRVGLCVGILMTNVGRVWRKTSES